MRCTWRTWVCRCRPRPDVDCGHRHDRGRGAQPCCPRPTVTEASRITMKAMDCRSLPDGEPQVAALAACPVPAGAGPPKTRVPGGTRPLLQSRCWQLWSAPATMPSHKSLRIKRVLGKKAKQVGCVQPAAALARNARLVAFEGRSSRAGSWRAPLQRAACARTRAAPPPPPLPPGAAWGPWRACVTPGTYACVAARGRGRGWRRHPADSKHHRQQSSTRTPDRSRASLAHTLDTEPSDPSLDPLPDG